MWIFTLQRHNDFFTSSKSSGNTRFLTVNLMGRHNISYKIRNTGVVTDIYVSWRRCSSSLRDSTSRTFSPDCAFRPLRSRLEFLLSRTSGRLEVKLKDIERIAVCAPTHVISWLTVQWEWCNKHKRCFAHSSWFSQVEDMYTAYKSKQKIPLPYIIHNCKLLVQTWYSQSFKK